MHGQQNIKIFETCWVLFQK